MLTRRSKAYSSSCSQTVSLFLAISSQFILYSWSVRCSQRIQKSIKTPYFGSSGSFKVYWIRIPAVQIVSKSFQQFSWKLGCSH